VDCDLIRPSVLRGPYPAKQTTRGFAWSGIEEYFANGPSGNPLRWHGKNNSSWVRNLNIVSHATIFYQNKHSNPSLSALRLSRCALCFNQQSSPLSLVAPLPFWPVNLVNPVLMPSSLQGLLFPPLLLALFFLYQYFGKLRPLNTIPNAHFTAPFSPIWLLSIRYRKRENRTVWESHKRLGPVIRLAPDEISVCTLQGIKTIYGVWDKDAWYEAMTNYG
jgi:hypothetical protein